MGILLTGTHLHYWGFDSMCLDYDRETVDAASQNKDPKQ